MLIEFNLKLNKFSTLGLSLKVICNNNLDTE